MKSTAISFHTSAQESALQILAVITIHRLSNYYRKNSTRKRPLLVLFLLKILYFRRKHIEKHTFPLVIATFFALFAADITKFMYHYDYRT